ncbi:hypothetical protein HAX54_004646, partial [Datura stramonium]|nr:hypothetical protein [Datura stramonium]
MTRRVIRSGNHSSSQSLGEKPVLRKFLELNKRADESLGVVTSRDVGRDPKEIFQIFLGGRLAKSHTPRFKVMSYW